MKPSKSGVWGFVMVCHLPKFGTKLHWCFLKNRMSMLCQCRYVKNMWIVPWKSSSPQQNRQGHTSHSTCTLLYASAQEFSRPAMARGSPNLLHGKNSKLPFISTLTTKNHLYLVVSSPPGLRRNGAKSSESALGTTSCALRWLWWFHSGFYGCSDGESHPWPLKLPEPIGYIR